MLETKDSGSKQEFDTGAKRDDELNKPMWHLIDPQELNRIQAIYSGILFQPDNTSPYFVGYHHKGEDIRYDLIPDLMLNRLATKYGQGAKKYGDHNWQKGIPLFRMFGSTLRHLFAWFMGDTSEDHLSAAIFNIAGIMCLEYLTLTGKIPSHIANAGPIHLHSNKPITLVTEDGVIKIVTFNES